MYTFRDISTIFFYLIAVLCYVDLVLSYDHNDGPDPWADIISSKPVECHCPICQSCASNNDPSATELLAFYKRLINIVFNQSKFKLSEDSDFLLRSMHLHVTEAQFKELATPISSIKNVQHIDGIVSEILAQSNGGTRELLRELFSTWTEMASYYLNSVIVKTLGIILIAILSMWFLKRTLKLGAVSGVIVVVLLSSYGWTYSKMYKEAEISAFLERKGQMSPPPECDPSTMSLWAYYITWDPNACKNYYTQMEKTTMESVDPGIVFIETVTQLVLHPVALVAEKLGQAIGIIFHAVPWPYNCVVFPLGLVIFVLLIVFIVSISCNVPMHFNFLHILSFGTRYQPSNTHQPQMNEQPTFNQLPNNNTVINSEGLQIVLDSFQRLAISSLEVSRSAINNPVAFSFARITNANITQEGARLENNGMEEISYTVEATTSLSTDVQDKNTASNPWINNSDFGQRRMDDPFSNVPVATDLATTCENKVEENLAMVERSKEEPNSTVTILQYEEYSENVQLNKEHEDTLEVLTTLDIVCDCSKSITREPRSETDNGDQENDSNASNMVSDKVNVK